MLDAAALGRLIDDIGEDATREVVAQFLLDTPRRVREAGEAVSARDAEQLRRLVHTVRSTAELVGALELAAAAGAVSAALRQTGLGPAANLWQSLPATAATAADELQRWLEG